MIYADLILFFISCIFLFLGVKCKIKTKKEKKVIIECLENIRMGKKNTYPCNEDSDVSRIAFLLQNIEGTYTLVTQEAYKEKESIKYVISNLSHQLKTPLANIKLYETFLEDCNLSVENRNLFQEKMRGQIGKLEWILESIIKCTRLEEGAIDFEAKMLSIKKTISSAIDTVTLKAAEKNIDITAEGTILDIDLYHNMKWTREVFINLLENAIKYSPDNSTIKIDIEQLETYTRISVKDEGIGIRKKEFSKIFQRFYRCKDAENIEGSGIGLYLCRLILEKEKGNITVSSNYGDGSTFQVYLLNTEPFQ
jgi:signal transduction histidine kinase